MIHIGEDKSRSTLLWSNTVPARSREDNSPRLIFNRYGDQYFLTQVWVGGDIDGRELPKFRRERHLAKQYLAKNVSVPQIVLVAVLRSTEEAVAALGLTAPALKTRLLRGRLMLREALAPHFQHKRREDNHA